jgi:hypothetical protein
MAMSERLASSAASAGLIPGSNSTCALGSTRNEMASFGETPQTINHLLCGWGFPTVPDGLAIQ